MYSDLFRKENYITSERYVSGRITEYDIKSANINVLYSAGIIDESYYNTLSRFPKQDREVAIGKLHLKKMQEENIDISKIISDEIMKYRELLFKTNKIQDNEVVRIAKDAVYILRSYNLSNLEFGKVVFRPKLTASSMINLNKILVFSQYNNLDQIEIEVKGLGKNDELHQNGMLSLIANIMYMVDRVGITDAIQYLQEIYSQYVSLQLPLDYYREFNSYSSYSIKGTSLKPLFVDESYRGLVDISYNIQYLRELYSILLSIFTDSIQL